MEGHVSPPLPVRLNPDLCDHESQLLPPGLPQYTTNIISVTWQVTADLTLWESQSLEMH